MSDIQLTDSRITSKLVSTITTDIPVAQLQILASSFLSNWSPFFHTFLHQALKYTKIFAEVGISLTAVSLAVLYRCQKYLVYPASLNEGTTFYDTPASYGMEYEEVKITTSDNETLDCFSLKQDKLGFQYKNKTILILGPNAGNISHYLPVVEYFYKYYGYNVFVYSYRGYGRSTGKPSESGLKLDAKAVLNYLANDEQYAESSIVLYGRSLGGAVALYMASIVSEYWDKINSEGINPSENKEGIEVADVTRMGVKFRRKNTSEITLNSKIETISSASTSSLESTTQETKEPKPQKYIYPKISGIVLENTFLSIQKVIPYIFPILGRIARLCTEKWASEEEILNIDSHIPMLFLSGLKDEIVPPTHMAKLFQLSKAEKKQFETFKNGYHNNTCNQEKYWYILRSFIKANIEPFE